MKKIHTEIYSCDDNPSPVIWLHASSLGEYGVARPIIKMLKQKGACRIVVTFFSPTGYEALRVHPPEIDHIFYLPWDTPGNARSFIECIQPQK